MNIYLWQRKTAVAFFALAVSAAEPARLSARSPAESADAEERRLARRGVDLMMDSDLDGATAVFREIQGQDPHSPIGYLLEAEALWWKIYYSTANLLDADVFDVASLSISPHDAHFNDLIAVTIKRSEAGLEAHDDVPRNLLYEGMAYALRARLEGLRGKDLPTGRAGKKMRSLLLRSVQMDTSLTDAYLGLGVYNYLVGTLPLADKIFQYVVALPAGSRQSGLEQLRRAAKEGELTSGEAKFYLAKNLSRASEGAYAKSLALFEELARDYPNNPLWPLVAASLKYRMGSKPESDALYRAVLERTAAERSDAERGVHRAARAALLAQHPDEKFGE
jgi:tetratricopeptide (TPR) repeat protein